MTDKEPHKLNIRPGEQPSTKYRLIIHESFLALPQHIITNLNLNLDAINQEHTSLADLHAPHIQRSEAAILETASLAPAISPKTALILGGAPYGDIPLKQLYDHFDHVTLIDISREHAIAAVEQLPEDQQAKTTIVLADLTGQIGQFITALDNISVDATAADYINEVQKLILEIEPSRAIDLTQFSDSIAFVSSHLVMSQLSTMMLQYFLKQLVERYGNAFPQNQLTQLQAIRAQFPELSIQIAHIESIARALIPHGTCHIADTTGGIQIQPFDPTINPLPVSSRIEYPGLRDLTEIIQDQFNVLNLTNWAYDRLTPTPTHMGEIFEVTCYSLQKP